MKNIIASVRAYYATNEKQIITIIQTSCFILFMAFILTMKDSVKEVIITAHNGDHEVILSNGKSILVESVYCQAYEIGQTIIFK